MKRTILTAALFLIIAAAAAYAGGNNEQTSGSSQPTGGASTAQQSGAQGAQTVADLARELGNRASVSGNTVTLTDGVNLERNLTVPEGVTLDRACRKQES